MKMAEMTGAVHTHTHCDFIEFSRVTRNVTLKIDVYKTDQLII